MVERSTNRRSEQVSEELLGVKVYFEDGLVSGLESPDGKRTSVNYVRKTNGRAKYDHRIPQVDEVIFPDGSKLKRDQASGEYLSPQGHMLYASPVVHVPSMGDNQAFIRYLDTNGNPRTTFANSGEVYGPCLPADRGLLLDLWRKNLPKIAKDESETVDLADLVKAVEDPQFTGMDAVFVATLKKQYDLIAKFDKGPCISEADIAKMDRCFQGFQLGFTGRRWGKSDDLDAILNSWVLFQNKSKFVTSELYAHGPAASIRPEYVLQGDVGNCYWQSSLMAIAKSHPKVIERMITKCSDGNYQVLFPQKRWCNEVYTVSPLTSVEQLLYSGGAGGGQWSGILEKAMGQYRTKYASQLNKPPRQDTQTVQDYSDGGQQVAMLNLLTDKICAGEAPHDSSLEKLHRILKEAVAKNMPMGAGIDKSKVKGLHGNHNYAILDYDADLRRVTLYDPNHYFEPKDKKGRDRDGVRNGIFVISLKEFQASCDELNFLDKPFEENVFVMPPLVRPDLFDDSNIVKENGEVASSTQAEAIALCKRLGGHLPTAREFAQYMNPNGILEVADIDKKYAGIVPEGYYLVECENEGGVKDNFYYNNNNSRKLTGEVAKLSFWTASKVVGNANYGHVFYGWLGGGRPSKEDHEANYRHAVLIIGD